METHAVPIGSTDRVMRIAVVLLVAASGAVETISFTALDHVFAGVMTSNLALLGMAIGQGRATGVSAALLALAGFGVGAAAVAWVTRGREGVATHWPSRVLSCLIAEVALLGVGAGAWAAVDGAPDAMLRDVLQFGSAMAMGAQAAAMVAAGRAAAPTTYLTGTLATYIVRGVGRSRRADGWVPARLGGLIVGAAGAMALRRVAPAWAGTLPAVLVAVAVVLACGPLLRVRRGLVAPE
ncbi:YoaK family protein [Streptomyces sp. NPDC005731]|uniref:YoaK family protein n=1 Tax=unclassified Streptomyces TaxID=2593676 RepID=UPI0033C5680B